MEGSVIWRLLVFLTIAHQGLGHNHTNQLLYILVDGFRYDYVTDQPASSLPGFTKFLKEGARAEWMTGVYPTLSFPSWTSLVTGQYPETHGIVGNYFYNAEDKDKFSLFDATSTGKKKWWTSEPIWTTATKAGLRTAVYMFGRCDIEFDDVKLEICEPFVKIEGKEIFRTNIDKALKSLEEGFDVVGVYTEHVDTTGHRNGPESKERKQAVRDIDETVLYLQEQLEEKNMTNAVNIIIVSDHGMQDTTSETTKKLDLDDYLDTSLVENIADKGAFLNIKVLEGKLDDVYNSLKKMPGADVYKKADIPAYLNYQDDENIHDIIIKANIGTFIRASKDNAKQLPIRDDTFVYSGAHGYDPDEKKMRATFLAKGPDFKQGVKFPSIKMVDVYPLLTDLLELSPNPNNGTLNSFYPALLHYTASANAVKTTLTTFILASILMFL